MSLAPSTNPPIPRYYHNITNHFAKIHILYREQALHTQKSELHELEARIREAEARLRERQALRASNPTRRPALPSQRTSSGASIPRSRRPIEDAFQNPALESSSEDQETTLPESAPSTPRRQENMPPEEAVVPAQGQVQNTTPNFSRPKSSASSNQGQGQKSQKSSTPNSASRHRESVSDTRAGGGRNSVSRGRA